MAGHVRHVAVVVAAVTLIGGCAKPTTGTSTDDIVEAASKGDVARVTLLLEEGADVNTTGEDGVTALHHAALLGREDLAQLLLDHEADPGAMTASKETPLHWAASGGSADVVRLLLKAGVDINARNAAGETPLDLAQSADGDYAEFVKYLRASNAKQGVELDAEGPAEGEVVAPKFRGQ